MTCDFDHNIEEKEYFVHSSQLPQPERGKEEMGTARRAGVVTLAGVASMSS